MQFFSQEGNKPQKTNTVASLGDCNRQSMSKRKTEHQDIYKKYILTLKEKCLLK